MIKFNRLRRYTLGAAITLAFISAANAFERPEPNDRVMKLPDLPVLSLTVLCYGEVIVQPIRIKVNQIGYRVMQIMQNRRNICPTETQDEPSPFGPAQAIDIVLGNVAEGG